MSDVARGRADLHLHTLASDGTAGVADMLRAARAADLHVVAITDHERIDAAVAGRAMAQDLGLGLEVIVGEEVTTLGGHLLGLFLERRVRPLRSLRDSIAEIHDQGGLAIPAHPLVPYPLCAQAWVLQRLLEDPDPRYRPDTIETFNPTAFGRFFHGRVTRFADRHGLARLGNSDAHAAEQVGTATTSFPGRTADDLRRAIRERQTDHHGTFHASSGQVALFGRQLAKYGRDARDEVRGRLLRDGSGRDLGYPGGPRRPPRIERT